LWLFHLGYLTIDHIFMFAAINLAMVCFTRQAQCHQGAIGTLLGIGPVAIPCNSLAGTYRLIVA